MAIVRMDFRDSRRSHVLTQGDAETAMLLTVNLWKSKINLIENAFAFRFLINGIWSNPLLVALNSEITERALGYIFLPDEENPVQTLAYAGNDLSVTAGTLLEVTLKDAQGVLVTRTNAVATFNTIVETLLLGQKKKRQWGLYIKLKRTAKTRSNKRNRLYIRVPHK